MTQGRKEESAGETVRAGDLPIRELKMNLRGHEMIKDCKMTYISKNLRKTEK